MEHRHCPSLPPRRSSELAAEFGRVPGDVVAIRVDPGEVGMPEPDLALNGQAGELAGRDADRLQRSHPAVIGPVVRSEEHTSELQSRENLVCRLLHEKKNE